MGPGDSASLGFPFSATVSVSKGALTPQELLHHLGKGDLGHVPCAAGWDWAPEHMENESPGGGIASEPGTCGTWWLRKEIQEFLPRCTF